MLMGDDVAGAGRKRMERWREGWKEKDRKRTVGRGWWGGEVGSREGKGLVMLEWREGK